MQDPAVIENMTAKLEHRGPDGKNHYTHPDVMLGFTRLSIIGLDNGTQPIMNEDNTIIMVCNGEIFNYRELKTELQQKGHVFLTDTDIEVILHLYEEYGAGFINRLNGQFAFFIYDFKQQQFFCARDHFGVIPFYYTEVNGFFVFASEIKAILEFPEYRRAVDITGLDQVFSFPGLISPRTMFKDIKSLQNGHFMEYKNQQLTDVEYWDICYPEEKDIQPAMPEHYYAEKLEELFERSVRHRLIADVPVGLYLSGGLDSSFISCTANRLSNGNVRDSYSISFEERDINEAGYQKMVADYAGLLHHEQLFQYRDIAERLPKTVYHSECPIKETYNTASEALSQKVRRNKLKVILSGEGADEIFAGYVGYKFDMMRGSGGYTSAQNNREESAIREMLWGDPAFFYEKEQFSFRQVKQTLYSDGINGHFHHHDCLHHFVADKSKLAGRCSLHKRAYLDYKLRLVDHLITDHGDKMGMANSVEARYPFLDRELVEFVAAMPPSLKLNMDMEEKYILKKIARGKIPDAIVEREKFGFVAPGSPYLLKKDIQYINDILSWDRIKRQGYFNPDAIEALKKKYLQPGFYINVPFESDLLLIVMTFGIFLDEFKLPSYR